MDLQKTFKPHPAAYLILFSALLLLNFVGCKERMEPRPPAKQPLAVNVFTLTRVESTTRTASFFGSLEPNRSLTVGFDVPGKLQTIVQRSKKVASGEVLAAMDVAQLEQNRKALQTQLSQQINQQQFPDLQRQIAELDQQIQARQIVAPFDCVVEETYANENGLIRAQSPILRIIETSHPTIKINLPIDVASFIQPGRDVYFVLDDDAVTGVLASKSATESAGSIVCRFDITSDLAGINFSFGQTVEASFNFQVDNSGYWVPMTALDRTGEGVWSLLSISTENGQSVVERTLVTIVEVRDDRALVDGSFSEGELAIFDGIHRVVPGQRVNPQSIEYNKETTGEEESE